VIYKITKYLLFSHMTDLLFFAATQIWQGQCQVPKI